MNERDDTAQARPGRRHIAHRLLRARDWQDRPQLGRLCEWWRGGSGAVCALVGIGGAGKTAIADRFVRSLPGVLPTPDVEVVEALAPPGALFVFSFYDAPNADAFFAELTAWLDDREDADVSYERTVRRLEKEADALLVLDGLEKVQDTGNRSGDFGRLLDGRLRDLVLRAAEGWLPGVRLLITSRFQLFDPLAEGSPRFRQIPIEQLTAGAAVALLRQRGVRGPDHRLEALAHDQGFHALSVDLSGGYVARFLDGDPARLAPDAAVPAAGAGVDPRVAALREQERRFSRLAERYGEALRASDPAALALLQRVCLFRLGVDAGTLAAIFTGEGKDEVAGLELARLDEAGLDAKLTLLTEMKLLERDEDERYHVHPAVRDGFLNNLDEETSQRGHDAAREGLEVSLGDQPGKNPSDPATLDLLEEIVYHTLAAGLVEEAWDVYWNRIGAYRNLGWRLGAYERGERICRAFAGGRPAEEAPMPEGLSEERQGIFVNEWALYLGGLGRLDAAARCYERASESDYRREKWWNVSTGNQNLTEVLLLAGRVLAASQAAEEALRLAERADDVWERCKSYAFRAHVRALRGEMSGALADFRDALRWQHESEEGSDGPLSSLGGVWHTLLLARLGQNERATRVTEANMEVSGEWGAQNKVTPQCHLVLADLARKRHDFRTARHHLDAAHEWAIARDAKELLCWTSLVRARLEPSPEDARRAVEDGLRIARDCGFGLYHVDLLLERARLALEDGDADTALADLDTALFEGARPPEDSGLPELLAATDPECGYAWGEAEGRQLRAKALLLRAAQELGRGVFDPTERSELPAEARSAIGEAEACLEEALERWRSLRDPESDNVNWLHPTTGDEYHHRAADAYRVLDDLAGGILTRRTLTGAGPSRGEPAPGRGEEAQSQGEATPGFDVFLSHNSRDKPAVRDLKQHLVAYRLTCWLDEDELRPGIPWQQALEEGIRRSGSVAVLVGNDGLGPWEDEEMRSALSLAVKDKRPVIPVLMPGAPARPELPMFLDNRTWVDLREGLTPKALNKLVWGITGIQP